jgi:hypothetical protein
MFNKLINTLTISTLFIAGIHANCTHGIYKCCSSSDAEVWYVDDDGNWGVENGEWCFIDTEKSSNDFDIDEINKSGTFDSMFIGAYVGGPEDHPKPTQKNIAAFESLQDRHLDVVHLFVHWDYEEETWEWTRKFVDIAKANGSIMMISWMPQPYTAQDILDGKGDEYIDTFVKGVKDFGEEIWLRPLHEANGDWYTWGTGADRINNSEDKLAAAYRHIVDRFRDANVTNVKWIWTTNCSNSGVATLTGSYPGDDYIDYTSIDGYNWGTAQSWSRWNTFEEVFDNAYKALIKIPKPIFLAEFSSSRFGGDKAGWFTDMFNLLPEKYPRIVGLVIFSRSKNETEADWALDSQEEAVEAWRKGVNAYPPAKRISGYSKNPESTPVICWSRKLGYRCCSADNTEVIVIDKDGKWGVEDQEWCGIIEN